ncbi:Uncharacterised protein [Bordetella pertussis]|nr:Uncharacterised protein [Bordetella pertussis]
MTALTPWGAPPYGMCMACVSVRDFSSSEDR